MESGRRRRSWREVFVNGDRQETQALGEAPAAQVALWRNGVGGDTERTRSTLRTRRARSTLRTRRARNTLRTGRSLQSPEDNENVQMRRGRPEREDGGGGFGASEGGWCIPEKCEGRQAMNGHLTSVWEKLQHGVGDLRGREHVGTGGRQLWECCPNLASDTRAEAVRALPTMRRLTCSLAGEDRFEEIGMTMVRSAPT